ncbi:hypothetical protein HK099_000026 [Clydaea vesicula]|uniref:Cyclin N-terminal domain-containing protein n=1 Tax=Clydaea vesicula TaxID=447962 RepID=A0AAD5U9L9_9FUNG|nr:hypothetical protein HK099_000026 [Clydaea vesicula]KAJ3395446.1 hypothetical protein HDU92_005836 [Lobulomyces angularis]
MDNLTTTTISDLVSYVVFKIWFEYDKETLIFISQNSNPHQQPYSISPISELNSMELLDFSYNTPNNEKEGLEELKYNFNRFKNFVYQIQIKSLCSGDCIVLALLFVSRLRKNSKKNFKLDQNGKPLKNSERSLWICCLVLANKYLDDDRFTNKAWSEVSRLPLSELNKAELQCLKILDFGLYVAEKEYTEWLDTLSKFFSEALSKIKENIPKEEVPVNNSKEVDVINSDLKKSFEIRGRELAMIESQKKRRRKLSIEWKSHSYHEQDHQHIPNISDINFQNQQINNFHYDNNFNHSQITSNNSSLANENFKKFPLINLHSDISPQNLHIKIAPTPSALQIPTTTSDNQNSLLYQNNLICQHQQIPSFQFLQQQAPPVTPFTPFHTNIFDTDQVSFTSSTTPDLTNLPSPSFNYNNGKNFNGNQVQQISLPFSNLNINYNNNHMEINNFSNNNMGVVEKDEFSPIEHVMDFNYY